MATSQTKHSANQYWNNVLYNIRGGGDELPTVTTDSLNMLFNLNAHIVGTVVSEGSADVEEYGFVWAAHDEPTIDDNVITVGSGSFTGEFNVTTPGGTFDLFETAYVAAYATNSVGTSYGNTLSGEPQICFAEGTLISTKNGSKKIEYIDYSDDLLVWNFDDGVLSYAKPVWILRPFKASYYGLVKFSNGLELRTVADGRGHRIFNIEKSMFTYSMNEDTPIGTTTVTKNEEIRVIEKKIIRKNTMFYNVITHTHFNMFANDILTSTGLNNIYPMANMKFVKSDRKLIAKNEFGKISGEIYNGLRLGEQGINCKDKIQNMLERKL